MPSSEGNDAIETAIIRLLLIGDCDRPEMLRVRDALIDVSAEIEIGHAADTAAVCRMVVDEDWHADLAVVCQSWPDEFSDEDVNRMLSLLPLTRWIVCFGSWCESDGRNRTIWPLAFRVPARCADARIRHEIDIACNRFPALPWTASRNEIAEFACGAEMTAISEGMERTEPRLVAIQSPDRDLQGWIQRLLRSAGFSVANPDDLPENGILVWDVDPWNAETSSELTAFCHAFPDATVIAIMGLAHPEDVVAIQSCGVHSVVTKLGAETELQAAITSSNRPSSPRRRQTVR